MGGRGKGLFHKVKDLLLQFGKLAGYHIPDNRVVHVVIAMYEAISEADDLRASIQLLKMIRETIPQSGTGLADHLEFSFDCGTAFRVMPVLCQIHAVDELLDVSRRVTDINQQFERFRPHRVTDWWNPRCDGKPGSSWLVG